MRHDDSDLPPGVRPVQNVCGPNSFQLAASTRVADELDAGHRCAATHLLDVEWRKLACSAEAALHETSPKRVHPCLSICVGGDHTHTCRSYEDQWFMVVGQNARAIEVVKGAGVVVEYLSEYCFLPRRGSRGMLYRKLTPPPGRSLAARVRHRHGHPLTPKKRTCLAVAAPRRRAAPRGGCSRSWP